MSWNEIAEHLGKSRRTVGSLAKEASGDAGRQANPTLQLKRRMLMTLAREGTSDASYLVEHVSSLSRTELERVLSLLVDEGLAVERDGGYSVSSKWHEILGPGLEERLDSLRHFLSGVGAVVERRFFYAEDESSAFARVLSFSSPAGATRALRDRVFDLIARCAGELDERAEGDLDSVQATVALAFVELPDG